VPPLKTRIPLHPLKRAPAWKCSLCKIRSYNSTKEANLILKLIFLFLQRISLHKKLLHPLVYQKIQNSHTVLPLLILFCRVKFTFD
jgi:hypothetical protein